MRSRFAAERKRDSHIIPAAVSARNGHIDILIPADKIQNACELAQSMDYKIISTVSHHVELQKRPYMNLELHTGLIAPTYEYYEYYKDP